MKVIILDDSRTDSYLASKVAMPYFSEIEVYGMPGEFHSALKKEPLADMILMDVHIGNLHNGIGELASIKEQYTAASLIPVVVVTASTDVALHDFARRNGAVEVIVKPITDEKLKPILLELFPELVAEEA